MESFFLCHSIYDSFDVNIDIRCPKYFSYEVQMNSINFGNYNNATLEDFAILDKIDVLKYTII